MRRLVWIGRVTRLGLRKGLMLLVSLFRCVASSVGFVEGFLQKADDTLFRPFRKTGLLGLVRFRLK